MTEAGAHGFVQFRCHVGHSFSIESVIAEQTEETERALWASVRALEESATLAQRVAARSGEDLQTRFEEKAATLRRQVEVIRSMLLGAAREPSLPVPTHPMGRLPRRRRSGMAGAMPKVGISAILAAWLGGFVLTGCQVFTAGEPVSEPNPVEARKKRTELAEKARTGAHKAKDTAHAAVNPHGSSPHDAPHGSPHGAPHGASGAAAAESATASHILIRYAGATRTTPDVTRSKDDARKLAEEVAQKASQPGTDFAELANEYTEDPSGKGRGGKLGTFPKGRMVPEFDTALFALKPGEVSGVIETPFGFHVVQREN